MKDAQGLELTTNSAVAAAAIDRFIDQALCYGRDAEAAILQATAADPTCALAHAYAAAYYLSQENRLARQQALPFLKRAHQHSLQATEREQIYIQSISAWAEGAIDRAIAGHEALAQRFPQDLISVQQGQYHYFYQGDSAGLLQIAETVHASHAENAYFLGMLAFGLEQCHQLEAAEQLGRQATAMQRSNPWAHHAVAHVLEMQGRSAEGIAWMLDLAPTWEQCNSMLLTHNWWHVALFYLAEGETDKVLELYDRFVWGWAQPDAPKDQVGAIALLLRLELQGVPVGDRWQQLAPHVRLRLHEHALPFQDLHYIYALAKAGLEQQAYEMLVSMYAHAQTLKAAERQRWLNITIPAAQALIAHATGHWQKAAVQLERVQPQLWAIGGSHAQRQLFDQIYRDALQQAELNRRDRWHHRSVA